MRTVASLAFLALPFRYRDGYAQKRSCMLIAVGNSKPTGIGGAECFEQIRSRQAAGLTSRARTRELSLRQLVQDLLGEVEAPSLLPLCCNRRFGAATHTVAEKIKDETALMKEGKQSANHQAIKKGPNTEAISWPSRECVWSIAAVPEQLTFGKEIHVVSGVDVKNVD